MSLPAWMSRMNAACFAASLDFEASLPALPVAPVSCLVGVPQASQGCVRNGKSASFCGGPRWADFEKGTHLKLG